jgi:NADH-quinone oxidoreductase subunit J
MLAQQQGRASYDRMTRAPRVATFSCFLIGWGVLYVLLTAKTAAVSDDGAEPLPPRTQYGNLRSIADRRDDEGAAVLERSVRPTALIPPPTLVKRPDGSTDTVPAPHVASLAGTLYTDHLVAVEVAGALLFLAMVGAVAITYVPKEQRAVHPEAPATEAAPS